ncbi:MAG TPA: sigma-54 dependent transcriptional regulator [Myxococcales bacterium]|nr:sigma-54 dependent transcriptional regulator [Myxococcales bacterium]
MNQPELRARILVVDDQKNMRATTALMLAHQGYAVEEAGDGETAIGMLSGGGFDLVLTDLKMEPLDGIAVLRRTLEVSPGTQVVLMTAYGTIDSAVEAMRLGAADYVAKPFKQEELLIRLQRALERRRLMREVGVWAGEFRQRFGLHALIGRSSPMRELMTKVGRVAGSDATVLVTGESGTGKELVARAIHAASTRSARPFVAVNCAAITETLLESELFGHAKGAFTGAIKARRGLFEEADGGSLLIDEVAETSPGFQAKLLRVLQEGEIRRVGENASVSVNVRVIAATNRDLRAAVAQKRFREDLFYRLAVVPLAVPSLRERKEDVPLLAQHFVERYNSRSGAKRVLTEAAVARLMTYDFPGNVRELENLVEKAAALAGQDELGPADFALDSAELPVAEAAVGALAHAVEIAERRAIEAAVRLHAADLAAVAHELRISPTTLWRKMKKLGISTQGLRGGDPHAEFT